MPPGEERLCFKAPSGKHCTPPRGPAISVSRPEADAGSSAGWHLPDFTLHFL